MKEVVSATIRDNHPELLSYIESEILRILEGRDEHKPEDNLGKSLMMFKKICHDEFEELES